MDNLIEQSIFALSVCTAQLCIDSFSQQFEAIVMRLLSYAYKYSASITSKTVACLSALRKES